MFNSRVIHSAPFPKPGKLGFHSKNALKFCEGCKQVMDPRKYKNHILDGTCDGKRKHRTLEEIQVSLQS